MFKATKRTHESYSICMVSSFTQDSCVTDSLYHEKNLIQVVGNLFAAGTDTTATTLRWALLLMAKYPQIQGKKNIHRHFMLYTIKDILSFDFDICCPTTFYVVVIKVRLTKCVCEFEPLCLKRFSINTVALTYYIN